MPDDNIGTLTPERLLLMQMEMFKGEEASAPGLGITKPAKIVEAGGSGVLLEGHPKVVPWESLLAVDGKPLVPADSLAEMRTLLGQTAGAVEKPAPEVEKALPPPEKPLPPAMEPGEMEAAAAPAGSQLSPPPPLTPPEPVLDTRFQGENGERFQATRAKPFVPELDTRMQGEGGERIDLGAPTPGQTREGHLAAVRSDLKDAETEMEGLRGGADLAPWQDEQAAQESPGFFVGRHVLAPAAGVLQATRVQSQTPEGVVLAGGRFLPWRAVESVTD